MATTAYRLEDRYTAERGTVLLTGLQALARVPVEQLRADRRAGHRTAAFVSGYPGSPLGGFDGEIRRVAQLTPDLPIVHRPGLNEEYAATAVMGSQLAAARPDAIYDGVVGIWYGKAPGVDRASDALRHAAYAGTARLSGAVAIVGDDPVAKSSTVPSSSAGVLADIHLPLLYPADPAEALDLGRHAIALSRSTGLWSALKIVADVADGSASLVLDPDRVRPILVGDDRSLRVPLPEGKLLTPLTLEMERDIYEVRYALATEYASVNQLNATTVDSPSAWIGIVASGITYREVREALKRLGLDSDDQIADVGIRLYRMQMPIPFDPAGVRAFAWGLEEVFVIEEKLPNVESLVKDALYDLAERPRVVGKRDPDGRSLVPGYGGLDADKIVPALRARLETRVGGRLTPPPPPPRERIPVALARTPFYCSGCPHNRSTEVPAGSVVGAGIGCHTLTLFMDPERVGDIAGVTCMGNEGTQWIGMAPFVETDHLVQNLGDGTFFHSGQLAITAAIAAGVHITYKLLYNGAVAMTGGQLPHGQLPVARITENLLNQGVAQVLITTDDTKRYRKVGLPKGVEVWNRDRLLEAQRHLAAVPGVTVLIHDQACAAEARRLRRRGKADTPTQRVVINHRVCEGCGDCGRVSNCLSVQPFDTPFGRKTRIDQTTCNFDYSCLEGDCPSFATIDTSPRLTDRLFRRWRSSPGPATPQARGTGDGPIALPSPEPIVPTESLNIRITGIGGTGVVTVAQVIGTAAMMSGYDVHGLDQIGLSQKAGPVVSDLCLRRGGTSYTNRVGGEQADLLLALDQLVAASDKGLSTVKEHHTVVVGSTSITPTGAMITTPEMLTPAPEDMEATIRTSAGDAPEFWADAMGITARVFGDAQTANVFVVGMAVQSGALPIAADHLEEALRLNGVAVEQNLASFRLGRRFVADGDIEMTAPLGRPPRPLAAELEARIAAFEPGSAIGEMLRRLSGELVAFQDEPLAHSFLDTVEIVVAAERRLGREPGRLTDAVGRNLYHLLAYKDEYEVARLITSGEGDDDLRRVAAEAGGRITYRLHPPMLRSLGMHRKLALPQWMAPGLAVLAKGKRLRGTALDPFGHTSMRRTERRLPSEYRAALERVLADLTPEGYPCAVEFAELPDAIRGYENLKARRVAEFRSRVAVVLSAEEPLTPGSASAG